LLVLGRPSKFTNRRNGLLDTLARQLSENLAAQGLFWLGRVEHQHTDIAQQEGGYVQITDGA
jgi:hypothetical protein